MTKKIRSFTDLQVWREANKLVLLIYKITKRFPAYERFGLSSQIQRSGVSVASNIAEGFSRSFVKEKIQFYYIALGSLTELQNQLLITKDLEYITKELFDVTAQQTVVVSKLLNSLIKKTRALTS